MNKIWFTFYNIIFIPLFYLIIQVLSLFNKKIKKGIEERKRLFEELVLSLITLDKKKKLIWFHSSSMGEFEQAKPLIRKIKNERDINIIATFFSPSGYENSKNYPYADIISYIPLDRISLAKRFLKIVNPDLAVMMRYDIWPNFIWQLKKNNIPCFIVDATMRSDSKRKLPVIRSFHKTIYKEITKILSVSEEDRHNFLQFGVSGKNVKAVGDTRFDRVFQKSVLAKEKKLFNKEILEGKKILVAGSSWESDEEVYLSAFIKLTEYEKNALLILVPHEPTIQRLEKLENFFSGKISSIRFSDMNDYKDEKIIIVDSIGILLTLYYYAHIAYVGGSFKQGIHNVLEPAVYGIPVLFGPRIDNSQEAKKLLELKAAMMIKNKKEAYRTLRLLFMNDDLRNDMGKVSFDYVNKNTGATEKIIKEIYKII